MYIKQCLEALQSPVKGASLTQVTGAQVCATVDELHALLVEQRSALTTQRRALAAAARLSACVVMGAADPRTFSEELDRTCVWTTENSPEHDLAIITRRVATIGSRTAALRFSDLGDSSRRPGGAADLIFRDVRGVAAEASAAHEQWSSEARSLAATPDPSRDDVAASAGGEAPRTASPVPFATPPRSSHRNDWGVTTPYYSTGPSNPSPFRVAVWPRSPARAVSPRPAPEPHCIPGTIWLASVLPLLTQCELITSTAAVSSTFLAITNQLIRRFDVSEGPSRTTLPAGIARGAARSVVATDLLARAVRRFPKLNTISMRDTGITTCPDAILARATGVTHLDFSRNRVRPFVCLRARR